MAETIRPEPDVEFLRPDAKGAVSRLGGKLIPLTANNFPEEKFRVRIINGEAMIFSGRYGTWLTSDGGGTKGKIGMRRYFRYKDPAELENEGISTLAMVEGDALRKGGFLLGITSTIDTDSAKDYRAVAALSYGVEKGVNEVKCAVLNGETAELGHMIDGYGDFSFVWNMTGKVLDIPKKRLQVKNIKPGQPVVALREETLRTNGYTDIDKVMQDLYLFTGGGLRDIARVQLAQFMVLRHEYDLRLEEPGSKSSRMVRDWAFSDTAPLLTSKKHSLPWDAAFPEIARELKKPSRLYTPVMYDAQGGVFGERRVKMVAAAHITGGGIPLKGIRMVYEKALGLDLDPVFPDPRALRWITELVRQNNEVNFFTDREACNNWNRGIGFLVVTENKDEARKLIDIAGLHNCDAAIAGEVTDQPAIKFRNHVWQYDPTAPMP